MTWWKANSPGASRQLTTRPATLAGAASCCLLLGVAGCGAKRPVDIASPRGMSYGVERADRPFHAVAVVAAARGTSRTAHDVLFEGLPAPVAPVGAASPVSVVIGLPRGDGLALVDEDAMVRDASLVLVEELVDDLRRRGIDARLDRQTTLALPPVDFAPTLRLSIWIETITVRRAKAHVDGRTRVHLWARGADGTARWEDDHALQVREDRAPFDVLRALGQAAAAKLAPRLTDRRPPHDSAEPRR